MQNVYRTLLLVLTLAVYEGNAQEGSRVFATTGLSLTTATGKLRQVLKPGIDFSSGLEAVLPDNWFAQGTLDMARLGYDQQQRDEKSAYLFRNTTADLLLIGLNGGRHFRLSGALSVAGYAGAGYFSIREPRVDLRNGIATQDDVSSHSAFGRLGTKLSLQTGIRFLQTVYVDAAWWTTPLQLQGYRLNGLTFIAGVKMSM